MARRPTNGWDRFGSLGHPIKFQRVSSLGFVTAPTSPNGGQPNFARCLAVSWAGTLYIHFRGLFPPDGILPGAKFTLCPNLAFSYIGSITVRHSSSGRHQTLRRGIFERQGGHPVRHLTVELSSLSSIDYLPWTNYCVKLEVGLQVTSPFIIQGVAKFVKSIVTPTVPLFDPKWKFVETVFLFHVPNFVLHSLDVYRMNDENGYSPFQW